jgi:hypothetical protein
MQRGGAAWRPVYTRQAGVGGEWPLNVTEATWERTFENMVHILPLRAQVFDEVHTIGLQDAEQNDLGGVLQRLLCLARCPVICLSATLANEKNFLDWLTSVKVCRLAVSEPYMAVCLECWARDKDIPITPQKDTPGY